MSGLPRFWSQPFRYLRWSAHERPHYFYSVFMGVSAAAIVLGAPPFRKLIGDHPIPKIPMTYPIPPGPRKIPEGYDDDE